MRRTSATAHVQNYANNTLRFNLAAAGRLLTGERDWRPLGHIDLTASVASSPVTTGLCFSIPSSSDSRTVIGFLRSIYLFGRAVRRSSSASCSR